MEKLQERKAVKASLKSNKKSEYDKLRQALKKLFKDEDLVKSAENINSNHKIKASPKPNAIRTNAQTVELKKMSNGVQSKGEQKQKQNMTKHAEGNTKENATNNMPSVSGVTVNGISKKSKQKKKINKQEKTAAQLPKAKSPTETVTNGTIPKVQKREASTKVPTPQKKKLKSETHRTVAVCEDSLQSDSESDLNFSLEDPYLPDLLFPYKKDISGFVSGGDYDEESSDEYSLSDSELDHYNSDTDEENYSDFDEDDYEEEEDSYLYDETDDDSEGNELFANSSDDEEYQLPPNVPEDIIIHQGTAVKCTLESDDNVQFDSDNDDAQIVELAVKDIITSVQQPKAYEREELLKLNLKQVQHTTLLQKTASKSDIKMRCNDDNDCPKLVPIVDADGFQMYNPDMDSSGESDAGSFIDMDSSLNADDVDSFDIGSDYEECSSDDSICSVDVNSKYMQKQAETSSSDEDEQERRQRRKLLEMSAVIISAKFCKVEKIAQKAITTKTNQRKLVCELKEELLPSQRMSKLLNAPAVANIISTNVENSEVESQTMTEATKPITKPTNASLTSMPTTMSATTPTTKPTAASNNTQTKDTASAASPTVPFYRATYSAAPAPPAECFSQPSRSIFCNAINSNHVLVLLKDPFCIYGTVKLKAIAGSIRIYGHEAKLGEELEIFSPRGCSVVQVDAIPSSKNYSKSQFDLDLQQLETYFSHGELNTIANNFVPQKDALLLLQLNGGRKKLLNHFKKYMSENLFPNMVSIRAERPHYASEFLLRCCLTDNEKCTLQLPYSWTQLPHLLCDTRLLIAGGKSVGKSTLLRYLLNRQLSEFEQGMLLIDLDIGQPELFVPQTISCTVVKQPLLGPGFFLNKQPDKAFAIGHTNVVLCAETYMCAVKQLLQHCHNNAAYKYLPWLVNTMGYNKGFGLELMSLVVDYLQPSDVVQLFSNKEINNFDFPLQPQLLASIPRNIYVAKQFQKAEPAKYYNYRLQVLSSAVQQESRYLRDWDMSPKDTRYAIILARLSDALQGNAEWLTDCKPLCAPLDSLKVINMLSTDNTREELLKSVEGNLVYLCRSAQEENDVLTSPLECFGIGIVRGIDYHVQQIYLLPAMPYPLMSSVNCLAIGEIPLPTSFFTNQGPKVKEIAPFVYNTIAVNASKSIKQIFHRPAEFLTGTHADLF